MYRAEFRGSVWILMDGSTRVGPAFAGKQEAKRYAQAHSDLAPTGSEPSLSREGDTVTARTVVEFIPESPIGDELKPLKADVPTGNSPTKDEVTTAAMRTLGRPTLKPGQTVMQPEEYLAPQPPAELMGKTRLRAAGHKRPAKPKRKPRKPVKKQRSKG